MKRLVMLLAVVSASVFAVSCEGLIDGFRDLIEDEMNDDESDGDDPMLEQGEPTCSMRHTILMWN